MATTPQDHRLTLIRSEGFETFEHEQKTILSRSALLWVLHGVATATKTPESNTRLVTQWILSSDKPCTFSPFDWRSAIGSHLLDNNEEARQLASLTLGVAILRGKSRLKKEVTVAELSLVWSLIHGVLTSQLLTRPLCSASRSAQGFLAVPLCCVSTEDGSIDELFRLHVWLPDGKRGNPELSVHAHQPFAQSWVLAGEGKNISWEVEPATELTTATHAQYALAWSDGKDLGATYKPHQTYSVVANTRSLMCATHMNTAVYTRDVSYTIPAAAFHSTEVLPDTLYATLFFFRFSPRICQRRRCVRSPRCRVIHPTT